MVKYEAMRSLEEAPQTDWRTLGYTIRRMDKEDIPQVQELEKESFSTLWPYTSFKKELRNKLAYYIVAQSLEEDKSFPEWAPYSLDLKPNEYVEVFSNGGNWWRRWTDGLRKLLLGRTHPQLPARRILGYAGIWFMVDEAHLVSIAVRKAHRRQGIGELLLIKAFELSAERNANFVTLEVRASNLGAQRLYEKYGFQKVGVRKRYYADNGEDALILTTDALEAPLFREHFDRLKEVYFQKHCETSKE